MRKIFITLILMLSIFSIANAHPFKSEKELQDFYAKIDKEVANIENEENQAELIERKEITRRLKRNITTKVDFEKLNLRELKQLDSLIKKMK